VGNEGNLDLADEIFDRYLAHQSDGSVLERGPEDVKRFMGEFRSAFADFHTTIEDQIAEGDKVVTRYTASGAPRNTGIVISRIADKKIAEEWIEHTPGSEFQ